ncbi:MAG: IS30 family transposase [Burkholderiales bacterium]|nr:IS30 family transposase [Burkholderiales bacterium]
MPDSTPCWASSCATNSSALSPEQIAGRLKRMHPEDLSQRVSHETIYQAVYLVPRGELRTELIAELRRSHAKRMPRARGTSRKGGNIVNLVPLSERPAEADSRLVPGHWEGDFIKGARNASAIGTAVERHSRFVLLTQMNGCTAQHALEGFSRRFKTVIPEMRQSFTYDRGCEMARHQELTEATDMPVYFCEPYSPWQRGSNENMNGLVRQFLPKGTDLSSITPQKLAYIEAMLNDRPRKILDFRTPREVYTEIVQAKLAETGGHCQNRCTSDLTPPLPASWMRIRPQFQSYVGSGHFFMWCRCGALP